MVRAIGCLPGVAAACLLVLAVAGCASPETRHEVLKVIFTGVPEPGSAASEEERPLTAAERVEAARRARARANFRQPEMFVHGPRASNECEGCHTLSTGPGMFSGGPKADAPNKGAKTAAPDNGKATASTKGRITPKLARPIPELCITCHSDKSGKRAQELGLMVHRPVTEGMCVDCHHPHGAPRQYMLLGEDSIALCMTCHAAGKKGRVPATAVHAKNPEKDCLECHNPHVGKTARLLKADFDEWQLYEVAR